MGGRAGYDRAGGGHGVWLAAGYRSRLCPAGGAGDPYAGAALLAQGLSVRVELILEPAGHLQGAFRSNVLPESYDACNRAAYEAFAAVFRGIVAKRLYLAGYRGSTDREAVEALVTETFGMSTVDYLMSYGPALLPSLEELQALYGGAGTYKAEEGILVRQFDGGAAEAREERYIRGDTDLILYGEADSGDAGFLGKPYPLAYTLRQPENQPKND